MTAPKFLADEDLREDIVQAVLAFDPSIDIVTVRQAGQRRAPDSQILQFAWAHSRIVVSHDDRSGHSAHRRPGWRCRLLIVPQRAERRAVVDDLVLIAKASDADEWRDRIDFLPW